MPAAPASYQSGSRAGNEEAAQGARGDDGGDDAARWRRGAPDGTPGQGPGDPGSDGPGDAQGALTRTVVLIGLMGCGKSSVGRVLAEQLKVPFRDSDTEIEAAAARSIPEIFEEFGEPEFRELERRVVARLLQGPAHVLATGGGAFMNPVTRALLLEQATPVWLRADLDVLVARTAGRTHRPLLNRGEPRQILAKLIDERYPVYAEAPVVVESRAQQTHAEMAGRIRAALAGAGIIGAGITGAGITGAGITGAGTTGEEGP